jgi:D-alanyl-D-alanine carboxypeptidase/D-alanyl-D-alanine-endopeptidase (penicillin-binding protein 4)
VAEHVSPPLSQFVKVILKVSYTRGADLMLCLAAVKAGSRDCVAGIASAIKLLDRVGVAKNSTYIFDGAGSDDHSHTSPADEAGFLAKITSEPWGAAVRGGMAVLGVDGTQATNGVGTPAAGHIQIKDGSRVAPVPGEDYGILIAKTQVGYIEAKSGRQLVYSVLLNNGPFTDFAEFIATDHDVAAVGIAIQGGY